MRFSWIAGIGIGLMIGNVLWAVFVSRDAMKVVERSLLQLVVLVAVWVKGLIDGVR